jgi:hypothetical protein
MSSMDFANFSDASRAITGIADGISTVGVAHIVLTPVIGTACSEMTVIGTLCSFYLTSF